jgi:hypothetical protein
MSYDTAQKVVGVGSWKFDSTAGNVAAYATVSNVLEAERRVSFYFRYDAVPDTETVLTQPASGTEIAYSGGGFVEHQAVILEDDSYATATPAQNDGQGSELGLFGFGIESSGVIPLGAIIDSVKIIYERKYDVDTSIGISRVKYRISGVEGPNHDNTDMPLTDTVVEVDVTGDRGWERQDLLDGVFDVIVEARRGDTAVEHTQSWDYVKVEVGYHIAVDILWVANSANAALFTIGLIERDSQVGLRFASGGNAFDSYASFAPNEWHRISFGYNLLGTDNLSIKLYLDSLPQLDLVEMGTSGLDAPVNLRYGWIGQPGVSKSCWFDQLYIDNGSDLSDPGNMLLTAKLPATVNADNFDTTGGTGAVNERPINLDNYRQQAATVQVHQNYTLQAVSVGDVDLSSETFVGHMGWVIAKKSGISGTFGFMLNGATTSFSLTSSPALHRLTALSTSYPGDAAGIGLLSTTSSNDTFLYECGVIIAYQGLIGADVLLDTQLLDNETLPTIVDDLRADPPTSYEVGCTFPDFDGTVEIVIHSLDQDNGSVSYQGTLHSNGRTRIVPGVEVRLDVTVTGVTMLQIWRRVNFD